MMMTDFTDVWLQRRHTHVESPAAPPAACFWFYKLPSGPGAEGPEVEVIVFLRPRSPWGGSDGGLGGACLLAPLLLAQELEDGGEVLVGVAPGAHDPEDLMGQRAQRDGGPSVGGRVLGQAQVLDGKRSEVRGLYSNMPVHESSTLLTQQETNSVLSCHLCVNALSDITKGN